MTARPMKGTAPRDADPGRASRRSQAARRKSDDRRSAAQRSVARRRSRAASKVPELFAVETYPTVLQMTSTVTAELEDGLGPIDLIEAIFPCGSITGAPKIRAMEIIAALEAGAARRLLRRDRQACAGRRSRVQCRDPDPDPARRRAASRGSASAPGSWPTASAGDEWRECLAKGAFVETAAALRPDRDDALRSARRHRRARPPPRPDEGAAPTRSISPSTGTRRATSCRPRPSAPGRARSGCCCRAAARWRSRCGRCPTPPAEPVAVALAPLPVAPDDFRLRHKTSDRAFYDEARAAAGAFEVLFARRGRASSPRAASPACSSSAAARLLTPPLARGLLPGVLRARLIDEGRAEEARPDRGRPRRRLPDRQCGARPRSRPVKVSAAP